MMGKMAKRRKEARYKTWYLQALIEIPSPFPPPWDFPSFEMGNYRAVQGRFVQTRSQLETVAAGIQPVTIGDFRCHPSEKLQDGDTLLSEENRVFIVLEGEPFIADKNATSQFKYFAARVTSRFVEAAKMEQYSGMGDYHL